MVGRLSDARTLGKRLIEYVREHFAGHQRSRRVSEVAVASLLFCIAFVAETERSPVSDIVTGAVLGVALAVVGFTCASRLRTLPERRLGERVRLAVWSLLAGAAAGGVILAELLVLAQLDPDSRRGVIASAALPLAQVLARAYGAAVIEEVAVRLFGMSLIASIAAARYGRSPESAFRIALGVTALLFGLAHLRGILLVGLVLVLVNGLGGLLLGWIFWRWGLPYAILCHFVAGILIQALGPRVLA
ncbi:MAG: CPBP family glutamic-type intramembrane protease [Chloroflexota bacterium]|nr:CPBP family glutamic-type intramembrane protease [Chloroflexota bacterium]